MTVAIVDYGSGNLHSAAKAFQRAAGETTGENVVVTADPDAVARADRIVLPGVGAFADCRAGLEARTGMIEALETRALKGGAPFLGICVGMQLMATRGLEFDGAEGLDWIHGDVVKLEPNDEALKVPHMGWNELTFGDHPLFEGLDQGAHAYFVHSFHLRPRDPAQRLAHVDYGEMVTAAVGRGNLVGVQFHPEKSQTVGLRLIANFLNWKP